MHQKKLRFWMILVLVLLIVVILCTVFRNTIWVYVAPKAALSSALSDALFQLEGRFQDDPLLILAKTANPDGKYSADVNILASDELLGPVSFQMNIQTNAASHQLSAEGTAAASDKTFDLSFYFDTDFLAFSSEDLAEGKYYGITYDSFVSDLRSIPLLDFVVSDSVIAQWDDSIQRIQDEMEKNYSLPIFPQFSDEDMQKFLIGIMALPCDIEKRSVVMADSTRDCLALSYSATKDQTKALLGDDLMADGSAVTVTFYLDRTSLIKVTAEYSSAEKSASYSLNLGYNPKEEPLNLQITKHEGGKTTESIITVESENTESTYAETWNIHGDGKEQVIAFEWDKHSGDMLLSQGNSTAVLNLSETKTGFNLNTDNLQSLLAILCENRMLAEKHKDISCSMVVREGSSISVPSYKNLDQWSLEDFFILLERIGSLFGIKLGE